MAGTYTSLHYHLVWAPKNRERLIHPGIRDPLYRYLHGVAEARQGRLLAAGGMDDHVHLLVTLPADYAPASAVRDLKANSSRWLHERYGYTLFSWQQGYGACTIGRGGHRLRAALHPGAGGASQAGALRGRVPAVPGGERHSLRRALYLRLGVASSALGEDGGERVRGGRGCRQAHACRQGYVAPSALAEGAKRGEGWARVAASSGLPPGLCRAFGARGR